MYFIRYQPLKDQLRSRTLTEREALPYIVVFAAAASIVTLLPSTVQNSVWAWANIGVTILLTVAGVIYSYFKNGGRDGFDFIQKFIVLGWVVGIRVSLTLVPVMMVIFFAIAWPQVTDDSATEVNMPTGWLDVLLTASFQVIMYQRLGKHIGDTTTHISAPTSPPDLP